MITTGLKYVDRRSILVLAFVGACVASPTAAEVPSGYALCVFSAEFTSKRYSYPDVRRETRGMAWKSPVYFVDDDPIPSERVLEEAFAIYVRSRGRISFNENHTGAQVDCKITRAESIEFDATRPAWWTLWDEVRDRVVRESEELASHWASRGYRVRDVLSGWDSKRGRADDLFEDNDDWRGQTQHP